MEIKPLDIKVLNMVKADLMSLCRFAHSKIVNGFEFKFSINNRHRYLYYYVDGTNLLSARKEKAVINDVMFNILCNIVEDLKYAYNCNYITRVTVDYYALYYNTCNIKVHTVQDGKYNGIWVDFYADHEDDYIKRTDYYVTIKKVKPGVKIYNALDGLNYESNQNYNIVIIGTVGEKYLSTEEEVRRIYKVPNIELSYLKEYKVHPKSDMFIYNCKVVENKGIIQTSYASNVMADVGDYLVCKRICDVPQVNDFWLVKKKIFSNTYRKLNHENIFADK